MEVMVLQFVRFDSKHGVGALNGAAAVAQCHCCFCARLMCFLQTGKLHFGVILGWSVVCSIVVWLVVNSMAGADNPESQSLGLYSCCCLLGYCLLPMIVFALLALIIPR